MKNVAVIGAGAWGKNLVRVFHKLGALRAICDTNPATDQFFIDIDTQTEEVFMISVINTLGICVYEQIVNNFFPGSAHYVIPCKSMASGIYTVKIQTKNGGDIT